MVDIAAHATKGVTILNCKETQEEIMNMFKNQLTHLKKHLNVSYHHPAVLLYFLTSALKSEVIQGEVSLTCDAWQALNTDRYFAVTGHWIEEPSSGIWELHSALSSFVWLNNAHNGKQLGGTLFKIFNHLGIAHKVSRY